MVGNKIKYLLIYTLILALPLVINAFIVPGGFSNLWGNLRDYSIYLLIGIIATFGTIKIRNLTLLFQVGTSIYWLLRILGSPLLYFDAEVLKFFQILIFTFIFYCWYFYFSKIVTIWQIMIVLFIPIVLTIMVLLQYSSWNFNYFINYHAEVIADSFLIFIGIIFGALICVISDNKKRFIAIIGIIVISFLFSTYLSMGIINIIIYGSITGKVEKPISFLFYNSDGELFNEKALKNKYSVVFVWNNKYAHLKALQNLEKYYWKYKNNTDVELFVLSINKMNKEIEFNPFVEYSSYHFNSPIYIAADSDRICRDLGVNYNEHYEFAFLLRNDTMIYRNTMLNVGEHLDNLLRKTQ